MQQHNYIKNTQLQCEQTDWPDYFLKKSGLHRYEDVGKEDNKLAAQKEGIPAAAGAV